MTDRWLRTAKIVLRCGSALIVAPLRGSYWLRSRVVGADRALEGSSQLLALVPGLAGQYLRRAFFSQVLAACPPSVTIEFGTTFSKAGARLGDNVYIGPGCRLGLVNIERDVLIAAGVHVPSGARTHGIDDLDRPIRNQPGTRAVVRIGSGSWIGSAAVIMADVGRNAVVGAGAVVTHPLPDSCVAGGVPARVLRIRRPIAS
jgi:virginiamycin A acetyltransferase